jgi:hypothetical protein
MKQPNGGPKQRKILAPSAQKVQGKNLKAITGEDPVPNNDRGNVPQMTRAWLNWARDRGF